MARAAMTGPSAWDGQLAKEFGERRTRQLLRRRLTVDGPQGRELSVGGKPYLAFCSNDYLGLANHPGVIAALQAGASEFGVGSGASHLVTGHLAPHQRLEEELAQFVGAERALVFSTGYMANLGVANALLGRGDTILEDRLNHASLIDAGLLTRATLKRYPHADANAAARFAGRAAGRVLLATDGVFSMDGDLAPVAALLDTAKQIGGRLLVDDAHGLGVLGANGGGTLAQFDITVTGPVVLMGTLGKAFGTFGAFVAGDEVLIEHLIQHARTYIYTTAPPPALAEATRAALGTVRREGWRRSHVLSLVQRFRRRAVELGLPLMNSATPIQPVVVGSSERALAASRALADNGILVTAIRPPTVPRGSARLRITFSASHSEQDVDRLLDVLGRLVSHGVIET